MRTIQKPNVKRIHKGVRSSSRVNINTKSAEFRKRIMNERVRPRRQAQFTRRDKSVKGRKIRGTFHNPPRDAGLGLMKGKSPPSKRVSSKRAATAKKTQQWIDRQTLQGDHGYQDAYMFNHQYPVAQNQNQPTEAPIERLPWGPTPENLQRDRDHPQFNIQPDWYKEKVLERLPKPFGGSIVSRLFSPKNKSIVPAPRGRGTFSIEELRKKESQSWLDQKRWEDYWAGNTTVGAV